MESCAVPKEGNKILKVKLTEGKGGGGRRAQRKEKKIHFAPNKDLPARVISVL